MRFAKESAKKAQELLREGLKVKEIALKMDVKESTIERYLRYARESKTNLASILLIDIETAPLLLWSWGLYKQQPQPEQIHKDWCILSWSARWLYSSKVLSDVLTSDEAIERDDKRLLRGIWALLDKADMIVAHNAVNFDIRKLNSRFLTGNFPPYSPYQVIDTLRASKRMFAHPSHKLDYLTKHFKLSHKLHHEGLNLWKRCCAGDKEALADMLKYNEHDIYSLEDYYLLLRPWIPSHPNVNLYVDEITEKGCSRCGCTELLADGYYVTPAGKYQALRCTNCLGFSRGRVSLLTTKDRENLIVSVAR